MSVSTSEIRCHFLARQLVYWVSNLGERKKAISAYGVDFYPDFWTIGWRTLIPVDRKALKRVALLLLELAAEPNIHHFHLAGIALGLESLTQTEQWRLVDILEEHYGPATGL